MLNKKNKKFNKEIKKRFSKEMKMNKTKKEKFTQSPIAFLYHYRLLSIHTLKGHN